MRSRSVHSACVALVLGFAAIFLIVGGGCDSQVDIKNPPTVSDPPPAPPGTPSSDDVIGLRKNKQQKPRARASSPR